MGGAGVGTDGGPSMTGNDIDRARDALQFLDPGCGREDWHRIGRAAIAAGLNVDDIDAWSCNASNYKGEQDVRAAFRTVTPNGGTGAGTLFHLARAEGWTPTANDSARHTQRTRPARAPHRPAQPTKPQRPGMNAAERLATLRTGRRIACLHRSQARHGRRAARGACW